MSVQQIIKKRRTIRIYKKKLISKNLIKKIIESGRWAPSPHNSQPWLFVVIRNNKLKEKLLKLLNRSSKEFLVGVRVLFKNTIQIIEKAPLIILVYNTKSFSQKVKKLGEPYFSNAYISEIQGISSAIQNMYLMATSLGIGMAWLTFPLLVKEKINRLLKIKKYELVAILTLGYPAERGKRLKRKSLSEIVKFIEEESYIKK